MLGFVAFSCLFQQYFHITSLSSFKEVRYHFFLQTLIFSSMQIFKIFFIFSTQKVFHFFHLLQLQVFFTFLTSQNELKTVWIYMFFTAFLHQKCLKFFSPRPSLRSGLGIVKNISRGGSAWKKNIFFPFETKELSCFS